MQMYVCVGGRHFNYILSFFLRSTSREHLLFIAMNLIINWKISSHLIWRSIGASVWCRIYMLLQLISSLSELNLYHTHTHTQTHTDNGA